jgi:predicted nucleic acid-binding protein
LSDVLVVDASVWLAAFDPSEVDHPASVAFLQAVERDGTPLAIPAFGIVETGCAIARRTGSRAIAEEATRTLARNARLSVVPTHDQIVALALDIGIERRLRGADAVYAATAAHVGGRLITWDRELLERADARTPSAWSDARS